MNRQILKNSVDNFFYTRKILFFYFFKKLDLQNFFKICVFITQTERNVYLLKSWGGVSPNSFAK